MFSWFGKTETERKRDNYHTLYNRLSNALTEHDKKVSEAQSSYSSYNRSVPYVSSSRIPSNDFAPKRRELNTELMKYFNYEKDKRSELVSARSKAYERYQYYRSLAIQEAEAERRRREKEQQEARERWERWSNG